MRTIRRFREWMAEALSDSDGSASTSRVIAFLWSVVLLVVFSFTAVWETVHTGLMPKVEGWAMLLGAAQAGGTLGYLGNQLRRGVTERNTRNGKEEKE